MHRIACLSLLVLAACADEPDVLPGVEPLACDEPTERRTYRIDSLTLPLTGAEVDALGVDLDDDGVTDNQAGNAFSLVAQAYPDLAESTPPRLARRLAGDVVWPLAVETCGTRARVRVGDAAYAAAGSLENGRLVARLGTGAAPLGALADLADTDAAAGWHEVFPLEVDLRVDGATLTGTIAGGLAPGFEDLIAAGFLPYLQARLDAGDTDWGADVDADRDGQITPAELADNDLFAALVRPDLDVRGAGPPAVPAADGTSESFSFGFGIRAVEVDSAR